MTIKDIRLLEATSKLYEVLGVIEEDIGIGELSEKVKECAEILTNIIRIQKWVK